MECPNCHKKISDKSSKCPYCGKILAAGKLNFAAKQKKEETPQKNTLPTMEFSKSNEKHMNFASAPDKAEMPNNAAAPIPEAAEKPSANQTELMKQKIEKSSRYASEEEHEEVKDSTVSSSLPATYEHEEVEPEKHDPVSKSKEKKKLLLFGKKKKGKETDTVKPESFEDVEEEPVQEENFHQDEFSQSDAKFDPNEDGYYNDVLPVIAQEINKLPFENMLRILFTVIFVIGAIILLIVMS